MEFFRVGGAVRDGLLGKSSKDIDFAVVMPEEAKGFTAKTAFLILRSHLDAKGFEIFEEKPEHFTLRARFPKDHEQFGRQTCDFVMARKEGPYSDGRHPDWVEVGDLFDDLARRDFKMNAIAMASDGTLIDPHDGQVDIILRRISCVGSAEERFKEDALRALRAIRFSVCLNFSMSTDIWDALFSEWLPPLIADPVISVERIREELLRAFNADTLKTMLLLSNLTPTLRGVIFKDGLRLKPSLER